MDLPLNLKCEFYFFSPREYKDIVGAFRKYMKCSVKGLNVALEPENKNPSAF